MMTCGEEKKQFDPSDFGFCDYRCSRNSEGSFVLASDPFTGVLCPCRGGDQGESSGMVATIPISSKQYKLALDIIRVYYTPTSMDNF